jgi:hypothetical protein
MTEKIRILFLAANPKDTDTTQLRLGEEIREIGDKIRAADFRDSFDIVARWAVRPADLLQAFNEVRPHIVHFSGHGTEDAELILEDKDGNAKPVSEAAIGSLFQTAKDNIRLVLLNACHSEAQARAVSQQIECTVGMNTRIGDEAAIVFASNFYGALAFGRSVGQAFDQGRTALLLHGIPEENTPVLLARPGVDALRVDFVNRKPVNPVLPLIAFEILHSAVTSNSPVNFVRYDGGVTVLAGAKQFDCQFNLERAALLEHAVTMLIQVGWLKATDEELHHVTYAGYEAARKLQGQPPPAFLQVREQMPALIAQMKEALQTEDGKFVREFFILRSETASVNSSKPRFSFHENEHANLRGQIDVLENHGYLVNVTEGRTPIYGMTEEFVTLLLEYG